MDSEDSIRYICDIVQPGDVHPLKYVLRQIQTDYENSSDYLLKNCRNVVELDNYLKEYPYLFVVDNGKVARCTNDLESGRENADKYFEAVLTKSPNPMKIEELKKLADDAPTDVKVFIEKFYPHDEFKRYLQRRPHIFAMCSSSAVDLIERESAKYFQKAMKVAGEGVRFMSLRGHVAQAPDHVRRYVNAQYPDTEFRYFLEKNNEKFLLKNNGFVYSA